MKKTQLFWWSFVALFALIPAVSAEIRLVPSQYATIQAGIDAAVQGDTVLVAPGTYTGTGNRDMDFLGKAIHVTAEYGTEVTTIDCMGSETEPHRAFTFASGETNSSQLIGFTIINGFTVGYPGYGGAIYIEEAAPAITQCTLEYNGTQAAGGAIYCFNAPGVVIDTCTFRDNIIEYGSGGAVYAKDSDITIADSVFSANQSAGYSGQGGAVAGIDNTAFTISGCIFVNNHATSEDPLAGGTESSGGAVYSFRSPLTVEDSTFHMNTAYLHGAGICIEAGSGAVTNCYIAENEALQRGGGIYYSEEAEGSVTGSYFEDNRALYGAGICCSYSSPVIGGSNQDGNTFTGNLAGTGADIASLYVPADPIIATFNEFIGYIHSDYYISPRGIFDLTGCTYIQSPVTQDVYISVTGDDDNDGLTWDTAFRTAQHAMSLLFAESDNPLTVHFGPGTFSPSTTGEVFPIPALNYVSFTGLSRQDTILDAQGTGGGLFIHRDPAVTVENMRITGGSAARGGGIYSHRSSPVIRHCDLWNNAADTYRKRGGGFFGHYSNPEIYDCVFKNNSADEGGGVYLHRCIAVVDQCLFAGNFAEDLGGGISVNYNEPSESLSCCVNCIFEGNTCAYEGGGIHCVAADHTFFNCLITGNSGRYGGGVGLYIVGDQTRFENCTITGNSAHYYGGGIVGSKFAHFVMENSIVWGNEPDEISSCYPDITYSDINGGHAGEGNIDADPLFVFGPDGGFYLSHTDTGHSDSPCLNSGSDAAEAVCHIDTGGEVCMNDMTTRTDHEPDTGIVDMGYHFGMQPEPCVHSGDVDGSETLTPEDALMSFEIYLGIEPNPAYWEQCAADCDGSESVTPSDALCIFQNYVSGSCDCVDP